MDANFSTSRPIKFWVFVCLVFMVSLIPRIIYMVQTEPYFSDQYWEISESIVKRLSYEVHRESKQDPLSRLKVFYNQDEPTAVRTPSTPVFLAICRLIFNENITAIRTFSVILGSMVSVVIFLTVRNFQGDNPALIAGMLWALWPSAIIESSYNTFLSEPIACYCVSLFLYLITIKNQSVAVKILTGVVMGIGVLNRSEFIIFLVLMYCYLFLFLADSRKNTLVSWVVCLAIMAPWLARNWIVFGVPTMSTLNGFGLWLGNNPWSRGSFNGDFHDDLRVDESPQLIYVAEKFPDIWDVSELQRSGYFKTATKDYLISTLKNDPMHLVWLYSRKFLIFWSMGDDARPQSKLDLWYIRTMVLTFVIMMFFGDKSRIYYLFTIPMFASLTMALIAFPGARYRVPYEIGMVIFLSIQIAALIESRKGLYAT